MGSEINAELNRALKVSHDSVMQVSIAKELVRRRRSLAGDPLDTTPERVELEGRAA